MNVHQLLYDSRKTAQKKAKKIRQDFSQQSEKGRFKDTDLTEHSSFLLELKKKAGQGD